MSVTTPSYTQNVTPTGLTAGGQVLAIGAVARGTLDLRTAWGAWLHINIGRGGTTAITNALQVQIRRIDNIATAGAIHGASSPALTSSLTAANSTTVAVNSSSGQAALNVTSITGFAAGDIVLIQDAGGGVTRIEWKRVSKTATGILTMDAPLDYTHTSAQADTVRNKADVFAPIWLDGGAVWEVILDYGAEASAQSVTILCAAQTFDTLSTT